MQDFIDRVRGLWELKAQKDALAEQLSGLSKEFEAKKTETMKIMEAMGVEKQHVPGCGTIYRQTEFSVQVPKTPAEKEELFNWIAVHKGKDVLDALLSIHSASLNAFYKAELGVAQEKGDVNFKIPGIKPPEAYYKLGMRAT